MDLEHRCFKVPVMMTTAKAVIDYHTINHFCFLSEQQMQLGISISLLQYLYQSINPDTLWLTYVSLANFKAVQVTLACEPETSLSCLKALFASSSLDDS